MKLYLEDDRGNKCEVEKAVGLQQGDIVLIPKCIWSEETTKQMEKCFSDRIGRKVIILDSRFRDILIVPPVLGTVDNPFQTDSPD